MKPKDDHNETVMGENYIESRYTYFGTPTDEGQRMQSTDVWYAIKPTAPRYLVVNRDETPVEGAEAVVTTAWSLHKAGQEIIYIFDRDDVNGLRSLLDAIDQDFDRRDMEKLYSQVADEDEDEDID